jgi:DNA-binding MarR family transcriptional regulator
MLQKCYVEMKMTDSIELNEYEKVWANLNVTYVALRRARELELARVGITIPQAGVLWFLAMSKEPLTPMKLSRLMSRQPHTLSALVTRMEAQGLVSTKKDMKRKNWVRVSMTKKGEEAFKSQWSQRAAMNVTSCLSQKDNQALDAMCKKLHRKGTELIREMQPSPYSEPLF